MKTLIVFVLVMSSLDLTAADLTPFFTGKNVVITGGSSGIGAATAEKLASYGANVFIIGRDLERLSVEERKLNGLRRTKSQVFGAYPADVSRRPSLEGALAQILSERRQIDIFISNAGSSFPALLENITPEKIDELIDTNLKAGIWGTQFLQEHFKQRATGHFAYVASLAGEINIAGYSVYGATKAATISFADGMRNEFSRSGQDIRVSVILPPDTDTPMLTEENRTKPKITKVLSEGAPAVSPEFVADALLDGMARGKFKIVPGKNGKLVYGLSRLLPGCVRVMLDRTVRNAPDEFF